jgi:hypothetical protein
MRRAELSGRFLIAGAGFTHVRPSAIKPNMFVDSSGLQIGVWVRSGDLLRARCTRLRIRTRRSLEELPAESDDVAGWLFSSASPTNRCRLAVSGAFVSERARPRHKRRLRLTNSDRVVHDDVGHLLGWLLVATSQTVSCEHC